jgi:outer membrane protein OmpA-like peptidoglycan-associated protein
MASKKYILFLGVMCLFASASFSQVGTSYDVRDSSLIPAKRQPQHNEFLNNAYPFPAMPRNQWEVGVKVGTVTVLGDVPAIFPTFGFGAHVRKSFGYVFSLRADFAYGIAKGLNWKPRTAGFSDPYQAAGYPGTPGTIIYDNYKSKIKDFNLEGVFSLNNIRFHKAKTGVNFYALVGPGVTWFKTTTIIAHGDGTLFTADYANIFAQHGDAYKDRKSIRSALKSLISGGKEVLAENELNSKAKLGSDNTLVVNMSFGFGMAFKLNEKLNLAIEDRYVTPFRTDLLDGQRWQNTLTPYGNKVLTPDYDSYNRLTVGLNINLGKKSVEPLWWLNPLDYAYDELNAPRHMKFPKPVLDDSDGDGVTDQFDLEPNTPKGAPVDSHGVSRDTDGDGVPDYKDKELITPTQCQPVDADGVGKCPPPACCQELKAYIDSVGVRGTKCSIGDLPSVSFSGKSVTLSKDAKAVLASVAEKMRNNPNCKVAVVGYGESNKAAQQLSWDRVNAVITYLVEKEGISADRFIFKHSQAEGDANTVDLRDGTGQEGPSTVPAPHPNLRKKK